MVVERSAKPRVQVAANAPAPPRLPFECEWLPARPVAWPRLRLLFSGPTRPELRLAFGTYPSKTTTIIAITTTTTTTAMTRKQNNNDNDNENKKTSKQLMGR